MGVSLRTPAKSGTKKNLKILCGVYPEQIEGLRMTRWKFLRKVYPACPERSYGELAEGLKMTLSTFPMDAT